jgi:hypothetical protein
MIDALYRVYAREWLVMYVSDSLEVPGAQECKDVFRERYAGRVLDEEWRTVHVGAFRPGRKALEMLLWNLQGEYKDRGLAEKLKAERPQAVLVEAGSPEERELLNYGRRMLPQRGARGGGSGDGGADERA